jgi:hypothetical protein
MAPPTLITGFFDMKVPIPGPSMNPDEHERCACWLCLWPARPLILTSQLLFTHYRRFKSTIALFANLFLVLNPFLQQLCLVFFAISRTFLLFLHVHLSVFTNTKCEMLQTANATPAERLYRLRVFHVDWLQVLENMEMIDVFIPFRHIFLPPFEFTFKIAS